jgi:Mg-chelatase subunit ChlD
MNMRRRITAAALIVLAASGIVRFASGADIAPAKKPRIEVCFVLDTTGSMGGLIEGAKQKIWSIANQMVSAKPTPELKLALIGYRDRSDEYVTRLHDLTDDIDAVYEKLRAFKAGGGGDTPESVNQALHECVEKISWSQDRDVLKIVFLVGDAPPHMDYRDDVKYPQICQDAVKRDLIINTVQCGSIKGTQPIWQEIANLAEGSYTAIGQTGNMVAIATPMDAEISELNKAIGRTLIAYGAERERRVVIAKQAAAEAASAPASADRLSYNMRTSKSVQGGGELLDALDEGRIKLDAVKKSELPPELRKLSDDELRAYVEKQQAERTELKKKLAGLLNKRSEHIEAEKKRLAEGGIKDSFDEKVQETIRVQAARKGIVYGE